MKIQESKEKGKDNYDRELEDVIKKLIIECDRKITRALKRLDEDDDKAAIAIVVSEVTKVYEIFFECTYFFFSFHSNRMIQMILSRG